MQDVEKDSWQNSKLTPAFRRRAGFQAHFLILRACTVTPLRQHADDRAVGRAQPRRIEIQPWELI